MVLDPDPRVAQSLAEVLRSDGARAEAFTSLLGDAGSCRDLVAQVLQRCGRLDGLIHNAGLLAWCDPAEVDEALYARLTAVNSDAPFWLLSAVLPGMRQQGFGRILLTTSGWACTPSPGSGRLVLYCQGKGAQLGLALARLEIIGSCNLGARAEDPLIAGAALAELAAGEDNA